MSIFEGVNLFESTRGVTLLETTTTTDFSNEPTGVSYDPVGDRLFVSDDNRRDIYEVKRGSDGRFGTDDDDVTMLFDTRDFGGNDHGGRRIRLGGRRALHRGWLGRGGLSGPTRVRTVNSTGRRPVATTSSASSTSRVSGRRIRRESPGDEVSGTCSSPTGTSDVILEVDTSGNLVRSIDKLRRPHPGGWDLDCGVSRAAIIVTGLQWREENSCVFRWYDGSAFQ